MKEPKIRLKGYSGEWETKSLSEILTISTEQNKRNVFTKEDVFSVSDDFGIVNQIKHLGRSYAGKSLTGYKVLRTNQVVYTKSPLRAKPYGIIKVNEAGVGIVSVLYAIYDVNEGTNPKFIDRYFEPSYRTNNYLLPLINKGAKNTINISDQIAINGSIYLPADKNEQIAICAYLDKLDHQIQNTSRKIDSLRQIKAASLQSMFPQEGETKPRVRFKGFEGEWENVPLFSFAKKSTEKNGNMNYTITLTNSAEYGVINQRDFFDHDISNDEHINGYYVIHNDDFVYNPRISASAPVGPINRNRLGYSGVMSPLYLIFKVEGINKDFLSYFFKTKLWHNYMKLEGNTGARFDRLAISDAQFFNMPVIMPKQEKEQIVIASFFTNLDTQITLQAQRLEKLKQIKSACLDNMFV